MSRKIERLRVEAADAMTAALRAGRGGLGKPEGIPIGCKDPEAYITAASTFFRASRLAHEAGHSALGALYYQLGLTYQGLGEISTQL